MSNTPSLCLRGKVSITDLELLIALYQSPKTAFEIRQLLQFDNVGGHGPYTSRLRKKKLITSTRDSDGVTFTLTPEAEKIVEDLKGSIQRETV